MIDLAALKEQLKLLGHNLPDAQVIAILKDMNITYDGDDGDDDGQRSDGADEDDHFKPSGRTGSILDSFSSRPSANAAAGPPVPQPYGYTDRASAAALGPAARPAPHHHHQQHKHSSDDDSGDALDEEDEDDKDEPGLSCRHCTPPKSSGHTAYGATSVRAAYGGSHAAASSSARGSDFSPKGVKGAGVGGGASRHAWAEPSSQPADSNTPVPSGSGRGNASDGIDAQMARSLERLALARHGRGGQMPAAGGRVVNAAGVSTSKAPSTVFGSQQQQQKQQPPPSSASRVRDQAPKDAFLQRDAALPSSRSGQARPLYDDESDVRGAADRDRGGGVHGDWIHPQHQHQPQSQAGRHAHNDSYPEYGWEGAGGPPRCNLSPQSSTRSLASRASASSRGGGRGAKKVDRVQRYHQMQAEWSQSRFLKQAGGQPARGTNRKPVNFHSHFAAMHAAEDAGRQRLLRETRAKTKQDLGAAVDAPTANRRDELRWQTRMRMQEQT